MLNTELQKDGSKERLLDEAIYRICSSMPDEKIDLVRLRLALAEAFQSGSTTLFHLFKVGREIVAKQADISVPNV